VDYDYDYDETAPLGRGGMAVVYRATSKDSKAIVALKRPLPWPQADDRLRREIEALTAVTHDNVMPVRDHGVDEAGKPWYTMPVAEGSLKSLWESGRLGSDAEVVCRDVLQDICAGLGAMHDARYVHRDVTPQNILGFKDPFRDLGISWVIADCGLVRRPIGETTEGLTGSASRLGTDGYMAPESFGAPHEVTEAADVYSLGRIFAALLTGERPVLVTPLLPQDGAWRPVVRLFTKYDPRERPQTMPEAQRRAEELLEELPTSEKASFRAEVAAKGGRLTAQDPLWDVVSEHLGDFAFMVDDVTDVRASAAQDLAETRPELAAAIAERLAGHLTSGEYGTGRDFDSTNVHLNWIKAVLDGLLATERLELFGDLAPDYCRAVAAWDRWPHNNRLVPWLSALRDRAATSMARGIQHSGETTYFRSITEGRRFADPALSALLE